MPHTGVTVAIGDLAVYEAYEASTVALPQDYRDVQHGVSYKRMWLWQGLVACGQRAKIVRLYAGIVLNHVHEVVLQSY